MVLSKGREVVGLGYSRLSGDGARATDRGEESSNPNRVGRVRQEYDMNRWTDQVTQDRWGNWDRYLGRRVDQVTQGSHGNRDSGSAQQADRVTRVSRCNQR
jgi:hypothetical protein